MDAELLVLMTILSAMMALGAWAFWSRLQEDDSVGNILMFIFTILLGGCALLYSVVGWVVYLAQQLL